jgi:replicative DNA helicase Mcm
VADALETEAIKNKFDDFFESFYREEIEDLNIKFPQKKGILIDIKELEKFDPELASELIQSPDKILSPASASLKGKLHSEVSEDTQLHTRFFGQNVNTPLVQDVGSSFIGHLICLDCLIVKRSEIIPKVQIGTYKCTFCDAVYRVMLDTDEPEEMCPQCKRRGLKQVIEESKFVNLQKIAVQDPLERLRGNTPTWQLEVWMEDDLVNTVIPGDRIELTGVLRVRTRKNAKTKADANLFTMFLETVSIIPKQKDFADVEITDEEERQIKELAKDPQIYEKIGKSIAPSIYGHTEIKQAIALQLFGGTANKLLVDGGLIRSDMHILLMGDPGSAKTRLLQSVSKLVPKGIYVSGKSVTGGGMTAVAERDELSEGGWTLKAGALVLGSGGIVSIDEFDKIGDEDRAALHEALESQTISVAKAGIIATFTARCAVLAAANPKHGRFEANIYPSEQFNIPPTLLSRFDLIFPIKDVLDAELDRQIATHILTQHTAATAQLSAIKEYVQVERPPIEGDLLRKYISYARGHVVPRMEQEAANKIQDYYVELRKVGAKSGAVPITPRQIEGLVRMSEASAKTRLSNIVEVSDAERAIALSEFMLKTLAVDRSGRMDIDILQTGMPREKVDRINLIISLIKDLEEKEGYAQISKVMDEAAKEGMDSNAVKKFIGELERTGDIYSPKPGIVKVVNRSSE